MSSFMGIHPIIVKIFDLKKLKCQRYASAREKGFGITEGCEVFTLGSKNMF